MTASMDIVIYHNPDCGTSRNTLALIRQWGTEPHVIEYLKTPPSRALLARLVERMGIGVRALIRRKGTPYAELGLDSPDLTDDQLLDAMIAHPVLINRPIVVSPLGVKLCRPSDVALDLLPQAMARLRIEKEEGVPFLKDVAAVKLRYRYAGAWSDQWNGTPDRPLPDAVEMIVTRTGGTAFRELFLVGTGYRTRAERGVANAG